MPKSGVQDAKMTSKLSEKKLATNSAHAITDPRFTNIQKSALFRLPSKNVAHASLDARFAHVLSDERFISHAKVDRYGRRIQPSKGRNELKRLYLAEDPKTNNGTEVEEHSSSSGGEDDETVRKELARVSKTYDPARDGGFAESSSEDDTSDEEDAEDQEAEGFQFSESLNDNIPEGRVSSRIAVVNLDWDNIRAVDLMAVCSSFAPASGRILKVAIYPSDFGRERMEKEEIEGPPKDIFLANKPADTIVSESSSEGEEDEDDVDEKIKKSILKEQTSEDFDSTSLRRYQLERLRYYYAVLTCSSTECAEKIYNAIDGTEYLSSANFFDLRFVPDDMDFSEDKPRDECTQIPESYKPNDFVTDALQHSKVKLTWDMDDVARKEIQRKAFSGSRADIDENDLKAYLGSDSSGDESVHVEDPISGAGDDQFVEGADQPKLSKRDIERQRTRALLGLGAETKGQKSKQDIAPPVGDMQVTFSSGFSGLKDGAVLQNEPETGETTMERYIRKEKERKARRKERMKNAREGVSGDMNSKDQEMDSKGAVENLGFDDPFFTEPASAKAAEAAARKEAKKAKRAERKAEEAQSESQRAELERLLLDDTKGAENIEHFDMADIEKAEKMMRRRAKRKGKLSARERQALEAKEQDKFAINVEDERFQALHARSDYAIDPNHPKFKGTEGMKTLLEETRRKRRTEKSGIDYVGAERPGKRPKAQPENDTVDVSHLLARVKGRIEKQASK